MRFELMQLDYSVASLSVNENTGYIRDCEIKDKERLPLLALYGKNVIEDLNTWLRSRSIPKTRFRKWFAATAVSPEGFSLRNLGLNLSDQYWFRPQGSELSWAAVNLYKNDFIEATVSDLRSSGYTPDASSNGNLPKCWVIREGERFLLKEGSRPFYQQGFNEVISSRILDLCHISHVEYAMEPPAAQAGCVCKVFTGETVEYVPAHYIRQAVKKTNNENDYGHFLRCMEALHIPCSRKEIDRMLSFDYLINNEDRHYGNFGFLRNAETLEWQGMAPLFDHGNSLWYNSLDMDIRLSGQPSKPFRSIQEEQVRLVKKIDSSIVEISPSEITKQVSSVLKENPRISEERIERIASRVLARQEDLRRRMERMRNKSLARGGIER